MAPVYDIRPSVVSDSESLSDDESIVVLDIPSGMSDDNTDAIRGNDDASCSCFELPSKSDSDKSLDTSNAECNGLAELTSTGGGAQSVDLPEAAKARYNGDKLGPKEITESVVSNSVDDGPIDQPTDDGSHFKDNGNGSSVQEQFLNLTNQVQPGGVEMRIIDGDNSGLPQKIDSDEVLDVSVGLTSPRAGALAEPREQFPAKAECNDDKLKQEPDNGFTKDAESNSVHEGKKYPTADGDHGKQESTTVELRVNGKSDKAIARSDGIVEVKLSNTTIKTKTTRNTLKMVGKFCNKTGEKYVEKEVTKSGKIPQLGFSARLMYGNMELVVHSKGCLMITDDSFVAKMRLEQPYLLDATLDFQQATEVLLNQLRIDQVFFDKLTADRDEHREMFLNQLEHVIKQLAFGEEQINTRIEFLKFIERFKQYRCPSYVDLCDEVLRIQLKNDALRKQAKELEEVEQKASRREQLFRRFKFYADNQSKHLLTRLDSLLRKMVELHKDALFAKAPAYLHGPINSVSMEHLMLISSSDVKLFTDMSSVLSADIFEKPLQDLANRWINRVKSIKVDRLNKPLQLTSVSLFFICKSLEEVIIEITERSDHQATDLLKSSNLGWSPIKNIVWKSENAFTECLEREYDFIFRLLKHFEAASDFGRQPFQYEMHLFHNGHTEKTMSASRGVMSNVKNAIVRTGRVFGFGRPEPNPFGVPDDFYVWYCLLDNVLYHVLPPGCELDMFDNVFEGYVQMVRDARYDQMETLRVVTHNLARYIAQSCSYSRRTPLNTSLDKAVLRKQLDVFNFKTIQSVDPSKNFRDHVDAFNSFWKTRSDIIDQFPMKINLPEMFYLQEHLMEIMLIVLDKDVEVETRVAFFRTYNDFLIDLNDVSFDWYVKGIPEVDMQSVVNLGKVELVDNKWKDTNNRTYRVLDPKNFPTFIEILGKKSDVPKHYVIEVIRTLLERISFQLQRTHWAADVSLSDADQVVSTNELICAIRNSLLYLKEQTDYVSFELFYDERVKPFASVLESSNSLQDFSNRIYFIKESFWYIRKQNEISFEDALQQYDELNTAHDSQLLRESYSLYSMFFEEFMQLYVEEDYFERAFLIAEKVMAQHSNPVHFKTWDDRFKQEQVPQILAGLAAVWSILVSKDVAKAGKYFNPHCIQILCVLRLLSVDKAGRGIDKHLAQVLTGQGKSLVLGLLAALFALTGHRVRIACYSEYLAKRDEQDFLTFYEMFDVAKDVTYGTFDDLANEIIKPTVNGRTFRLRDLVKDLLFKSKVILPHRLVAPDSSNDVLLMDEVDVFFTKEFYGNRYRVGCFPSIPGLDRLQELIWEYVMAGYTDVESRIDQYIRSNEFEQRKEFLKFINRPESYTICKLGTTLTTYSNKTLFDEHVGLMIKEARKVYNKPETLLKFKLNSAGAITYNRRGIYSSCHVGYYNNFIYFLLKNENFVTKVNGIQNYGYLNINCGSLSYAMLPKNYPLIVGVSGTLTSLNQYEKDTIERLYSIKQISVMPTFFGCSNLQFDEVENFHHHATKSSWTTNIFSHANQKVAANRAVIVFFETDVELNAFEAEYAGQLDRVNVLTENTEDKERFISEAGVAKTITLATRGMGRGVDYKSSVTVEKNGGVHIIQTFFSMDVKEETQIKGRTARKDNKGSYELTVCDEDLKSGGLMSGLNNVTYAELDAARSKISLDANAELSKKIQDGIDAHRNTMDYLSSFFKK